MTTRTPRVSVIMANYNGAAHIAAAVRSVLRSTERSLELIVSDDGSQDESVAIVRGIGDPRIVLLEGEGAGGPAAARNRGLQAAKGDWIAIVDSDDFIHPERLERLLDAAARDGADIVADDLLTFYEDGSRQPHAHLRPFTEPSWVSAAAYARSNRILGDKPALGYLKPVFRRLGRDGAPVAYDERLRIAEDSDLIQRLLIAGARMCVYPELGYLYRKHAASISHRMGAGHIDAMAAALERWDASRDPALAAELRKSRAALRRARAFAGMVEALKARKLGAALGLALRAPSAVWFFKDALTKRVLPKPRLKLELPGPRITLLSRQRIVGQTNGSSSYVLALAGALRGAGYAVDYIGPSPLIFGRWAMMKLKPETEVFDRYLVRGGFRIGNLMLARDPGVWLASAMAVVDRVLGKLRLKLQLSKPATYAQGAEATREDMLFIARNSARTEAVFCDYCFLTPMAPYALSPDARIFTIMHDLMSARIADKAEANTVKLDAKTEFRLLGLSDTVVAIQKEEADAVRAALPNTKVTLALHAVPTVTAAQSGEDDTILFVGSNTAPNIVGLEWFFREIWPHVIEKRPSARLLVAGSVARALPDLPNGVRAPGVVPDLAPLYAAAGVVISPLYTGSGLKIKLIEALAAGKAVVGTSVTAQGVEDIVAGAMIVEDEPQRFAAALVELLSDKSARALLSNSALTCAEANFSPDATFAALLRDVRRDVHTTARDARALAQLTQ
ncbi:glycosyltransferase [Terricaulis sp.]|uniref:glycosyltransferase n=1 Tax=Terricaulis sp. TaxID=2768686 RepID=UPI003782D560